MTKQIRRTEIKIETLKITIIRSHSRLNPIYCRICDREVSTISFEQLAAISQAATLDFHQVETIDGLLVCANSLESNK